MEKKDFKTFAEYMTILHEVFVTSENKPLNKVKLNIYFKILENITIEQFIIGCNQILKTKTISIFPTTGEILEAIYGSSEIRAIQALKKLENAVDDYGYYHSIIFDDPVIMACVQRMGGWEWISTQQIDDWKWIRKDFCKLYSQLSQLHLTLIEAPQRLIGYCERVTEDFDDDKRLNHMVINLQEQKQLVNKEKKLIEGGLNER